MSKRFVVIAFSLCLAGVGGWALAQGGRPGIGKVAPPGDWYAVSATGQSAVLVETRTGKTWVLTQSVEGTSVWLPAQRLDSEEQMRAWLQLERERVATRDAMQRDLAHKLEAVQRELASKLEAVGKKPAQK